MTCRSVRRQLGAFVDEELPPRRREGIAAHLDACPHCAALADRHRRLWDLLGRAPEIEPSPGFQAAVRDAVREADRPRARRLSWAATLRRTCWAGAFALMLAVGLTLGRDMARPAPARADLIALSAFSAEPFGIAPEGTVSAVYLDLTADLGGG